MAGEYTLCNLDNHTYTSPYNGTEGANYNGYTGAEYGVHHGAGPGPPGASLELHSPAGLGYGEAGGMCDGEPAHSQAVFLHSDGQGYGAIACGGGSSAPQQHQGYPAPHAGYYGHGMTFNGGIADMPPHGLHSNGGYLGYPDPTNCNPLLGNPNASNTGYCLSPHEHVGLSSSPGSDQGPVTTYKWMTVKRGTPKTCKFNLFVFVAFMTRVPPYIVLCSKVTVQNMGTSGCAPATDKAISFSYIFISVAANTAYNHPNGMLNDAYILLTMILFIITE